ncbi:MAG: hypothetical protein WBM36_02490, partial [Lysobacterales bacterium]
CNASEERALDPSWQNASVRNWTIRNEPPRAVDCVAGDAPPFFIVFDPKDFPGKDPTKIPASRPKPNRTNALKQELTIITRTIKNTPECLNYRVVSHKGVLDPVFIIKR